MVGAMKPLFAPYTAVRLAGHGEVDAQSLAQAAGRRAAREQDDDPAHDHPLAVVEHELGEAPQDVPVDFRLFARSLSLGSGLERGHDGRLSPVF
jgi:hypothetical protein